MINPIAVLVEDDLQQSEVSKGVLESARFDVRVFDSIAPALEYLRASDELIDLFVLDRRLPVNAGEPATDELGDELLKEIRASHKDARLIVFTGYADVRHVQAALQGGGQLPMQSGQPIDRITVLEKDQSIEFRLIVSEFRQLLQTLEDIEISTSEGSHSLSYLDKRVLRRLAFEYHAVSISVVSLGGGLTGASVWKCELARQEGHIATIVAKRVKEFNPMGGLPDLMPRANTTSTMATLSGLMGGNYISVLQIAGDSPRALMTLLVEDPVKAVELACPVWTALHTVASQRQSLSIAEICKSLINWDEIAARLDPYGIEVPAGTLNATTRIGIRHGDLHPGNLLVDNDQAVLIDFDSSTFAAGLLDPVTMLISTLVHPDSPIRGSCWPDTAEVTERFGTADFGLGHGCEAWFQGVYKWIRESRTSDREFWALVLAYSARQLGYQDVLADPAVVDRVVAIARRAADVLAAT
ncbi:response regulator [Rhodococcus sp. 14C212]|uniref:response regulator n=1 Tax=Rhodococcus sp. 14C212 TaxID=2711209 RepID=UPI0013EE0679|nr:response regulator [Rhodococcus sp. 14C212]NGP05773.1 response regulator [Rhodococcus sp. 14C212]